MSPQRRRWLLRCLAGTTLPGLLPGLQPAQAADGDDPTPGDPVQRGRRLQFPADHGAHLGVRSEWWYVTGWLAPSGAASDNAVPAPTLGFQVTFFRNRTGLAQHLPGRFAPRQLLFAHAALTDLGTQRHLHDQRIVRWSGAADAAIGHAASADGNVHMGDWSLRRQDTAGAADAGNDASRWLTALTARDFVLALQLDTTQPPLLQGDAGFSRKGPQESQASHYYSLPQLAVTGTAAEMKNGRSTDGPPLSGRGWLDHEWSQQILHPDAVGWNWIGMNLFDGSALTAFVLRRRDGSPLWAGGSFRAPGQPTRAFAPDELRWQPGRIWRSPGSGASYPVQCQVQTPVGVFGVNALLDAQELDSRASTGAIYWEGLSELLDSQGRRVGLGYLEMTGYAAPLRMG